MESWTIEEQARIDGAECIDCGTPTENTIPWNMGYGRYKPIPMCDECEERREDEKEAKP